MRKLSEDIRLGVAMGVDEMRERFMDERDQCGCALGTAAYARGWTYKNIAEVELRRMQDASGDDITIACFQKGLYPEYPLKVLREVSRRHAHGESRLSIADWLEREIEPQLEKQNAEPSTEEVAARNAR